MNHEASKTEEELFHLILLCCASQRWSDALEVSQQLCHNSPLLSHLHEYIQGQVHGSQFGELYGKTEPFDAFVSGGGNIGLYETVSDKLCSIYFSARKSGCIRILDIGVGAGHALLPALRKLRDRCVQDSQEMPSVQLTLVEPSASMLQKTKEGLEELREKQEINITYEVIEGTVQTFIEQRAQQNQMKWDVTQSSFCLHYVTKEERPAIFQWIANNTEHFVMFEFDSPFITFASLEAATSLKQRYEKGVAEYSGETQKLVAQGFLIPFFLFCAGERKMKGEVAHTCSNIKQKKLLDFAHFDAPKEQTEKCWVEEVTKSITRTINTEKIYSYWWAECFDLTF